MNEPESSGDRIAALDDDRETLFMLGWRDAALALSAQYEERYDAEGNIPTEARPSRFLAMPVLYLFRHFFELRLKGLLRALAARDAIPIAPIQGHPLFPLWNRFLLHYSSAVQSKKIALEAPDTLFQMIDADDSSSQALRYETDTKGRPHFEKYDAINMTVTVRGCLLAMNVIDEMAVDLALEPPPPASYPGSPTDTNTDTR